MKNLKRGLIDGPLLVLLALLIASGVGFLIYSNQTKVSTGDKLVPPVENVEVTPTPTPSATPSTEAPTVTPTPSPSATPFAKTISLPKAGDRYLLGENLVIQWNPAAIDVSTIELVDVNGKYTGGYQIYRRELLSDPVSIKGKFVYPLPKLFQIFPGTYKVKLVTFGGKSSIQGDPFTIASPLPMVPKLDTLYSIKNVYGAKDSYKVGETFLVNVEAIDGNGKDASPDRGFNVQARLFNQQNSGIDSVNAVYEPNAKVWKVQFPPFAAGSDAYRVEIGLYCGSIALTSLCAQEHGTDQNVESFVTFTLNP